MEWCCPKCGLTVTADDWSLLVAMGWRSIAADEVRCVLCVKREPERMRPRVVPLEPARDRRGRRELC
jgi:hypothetical protein